MSTWLSVLLLVVAVAVGFFLLSNVLPRYVEAKRRRDRVAQFLTAYQSHANGDQTKVGWLAARALEMQRDAELVGEGVRYVAPPPAIGGAYLPHQMFRDLFSRQSFTGGLVTPTYRIQVLQAIDHEMRKLERQHKVELLNPWSWLSLSFERVVRFPQYVLRQAGFSKKVTDSGAVRIVTVVWSLAVGAAGIGSFVLALIVLLGD